MTEGNPWDLIRFRVQQMDESLVEARVLFEQDLYRGAVNRAYYAMFYAILALMGVKGLTSTKHKGAISVFDQQFIKSGLFPSDFSKWVHSTFDLRMGADYGDMYLVSKEKALDSIVKADQLTSRIKAHLADFPELK